MILAGLDYRPQIGLHTLLDRHMQPASLSDIRLEPQLRMRSLLNNTDQVQFEANDLQVYLPKTAQKIVSCWQDVRIS